MTGDDPLEGMQTEPCSFCGGSGTMRETRTLTFIPIEDGEEGEPETRRAVLGEQCPVCFGRGKTGVMGYGALSGGARWRRGTA
ncbi:MAG: hypothetical protein ACK4TP_10240 [Hyphomicrobium sp.]